MRSRNAIFAAMLAMAPLRAEAADLVVWWEQGVNPEEDRAVEETIAAFEQKTGKNVELVFPDQADLPGKVQAAIEAGQPPDFVFGLLIDPKIDPWAYDDRLVDLTEAIGPLVSMFDPDVLEASMLLNGRTRQRSLYALPVARSTNHLHVWTGLLEQAGFTLKDIPKEWEAFWSFWCDRVQPAVRQATGREDIWAVGLTMSLDTPGEPGSSSRSSSTPTTRIGERAPTATAGSPIPPHGTRFPLRAPALSRLSMVIRRSSGRAAPRPTRRADPKRNHHQQHGLPDAEGRHDAERDALDPQRAQE